MLILAGSLEGGTSALRRLSKSGETEEVVDHFREVLCAVGLATEGFQVCIRNPAHPGPDLAISLGPWTAEVEVKRFRPVNAGPGPLTEGGRMTAYGDIARDTRKAINAVSDKVNQVSAYPRSIIFLWSDDDALEDSEARFARDLLDEDVRRGSRVLPTGLQGILFGSRWTKIGAPEIDWLPFAGVAPMDERAGALLGRMNFRRSIERTVLFNDRVIAFLKGQGVASAGTSRLHSVAGLGMVGQ